MRRHELRAGLCNRGSAQRELQELHTIDGRSGPLERVGRLRGNEVRRRDEPRERGTRDTQIILRCQQGETRVADLNDRSQRIRERGRASAHASRRRLELRFRLTELSCRRGLGFPRRENGVVLRFHLQCNVEALG